MILDRTPRTKPLRRVRGIVSAILMVGLLGGFSTAPVVPEQDDCAIGNVTREDYQQIRAEMSRAPRIDWPAVARLQHKRRPPWRVETYLRDALTPVIAGHPADVALARMHAYARANGMVFLDQHDRDQRGTLLTEIPGRRQINAWAAEDYGYVLPRSALWRADVRCTVVIGIRAYRERPDSEFAIAHAFLTDPGTEGKCWPWTSYEQKFGSCPVLPTNVDRDPSETR